MEEREKNSVIEKIQQLKVKKNAVLLAHYYQTPEIQEVADYVGDSLGLSREAAKTDADIIVFAGVHFMAETAKILNPSKKVILPDLAAGCSLAESCPVDSFIAKRKQLPNHVAVTYINCSAEVKAHSDIICTSANALEIVNSIPKDKEILFSPDRNLGAYIAQETNRNLTLWDGQCDAHVNLSMDKIAMLKKEHQNAKLLAHPESEAHILAEADYVGSTTGIINFAKTNNATTFIIATEGGILHQMKKEIPNKKIIPAPSLEDNTCACSECVFMKMNSLEKILSCLENEYPEIQLEESVRQKAIIPIQKMLALKQ